MSQDPREVYPLGATLADGAYTLVARLRGDRFRGLYAGDGRDGSRVMVTVGGKQSRPYDEITARLALPVPGVPKLLHVGPVSRGPGTEPYDGMVELQPPGEPITGLPLPLHARAALGLAADVAAVCMRAHAAQLVLGELRPELTFTDLGGSFQALTPRCERFLETAARPNFALPPLYEDVCWSPEYLEGADAGPPSDVFAAGLLLARVATGEHAFEGEGRQEQSQAILSGARRPFRGPAAIGALVDAALERDPSNRPTIAAWREQLMDARALLLN